jgi:hypothetical protein
MNTDLINTLTALKPCKRREYLEINNYENINDILSEFIAHTKQSIKNTYTPSKSTATSFINKANKILEKPLNFQSVNFDTSNEPLPIFQYTKEWVDKTNIIAPITEPINELIKTEPIIKYIEEPEPEPIINNNYMIDICDGVYRVIINETTTIELDTNNKTFKIIDDKAIRNKTILSIKT